MAINNNSTTTVTLLVNGEQASSTLDKLKAKANELAAAFADAQKSGDKVKMQQLRGELGTVGRQIRELESSMKGVDKVMSDMASKSQRTGITGIKNRLGQVIGLKMPDWFKEKFPDFEKYYKGMDLRQMGDFYGQLMELSETFKNGSGTIKIDLPNGNSVELESVEEIRAMMERLLRMIESDKQLQAEWRDQQDPKKGAQAYKYAEEDAWKREQDNLNYIAMATGEKSYQQYLADRIEIEKNYLKKKIANWRSTDTEIMQFEKQISVLIDKEHTQQENMRKSESSKALREQRQQLQEQHEKRLADLEQQHDEGKLSYRAYHEAVLREEIDYLEKIKHYYKEGSSYRYFVEREINAKIKQERETKARELRDAEIALKKKYFKEDEVRNKEDIKHDYEVRSNALTILYQNMIQQANGNVKEMEDITKRYHKAMRREEIDMKRALGEEVTLTWREKLEEFNEWLGSDEAKKWETTIHEMAASMGSIFSSVSEMARIDSEIAIAKLEKRYEKEIKMAEGNHYIINQLEKKRAAEISKIKKEEAEKTFSLQVLQAIATTAENAVKAYGDALEIGGIAGLVMAPIAAGLAVAAGMVQVALITKQKNAAASIGYQKGGFTKPGREDEVAGVVHAGEWVASQRLVQSPVTRPLIEALDYAQKNNTFGTARLAGATVSTGRVESGEVREAAAAVVPVAASLNDNAVAMVVALEETRVLHGELRDTLEKLRKQLEMPSQAIVSITGDDGLERAQNTYQKLLNNKSPKSKRK